MRRRLTAITPAAIATPPWFITPRNGMAIRRRAGAPTRIRRRTSIIPLIGATGIISADPVAAA